MIHSNFASLVATLMALAFVNGAQVRHQASGAGCTCPTTSYVRLSSSATIANGDDYVELDTDAGVPLVCTLPTLPKNLERHEVWLGSQPGLPGGFATVNPNGQPVHFTPGLSSLVLDEANEGLVLLFVRPTPEGGGYWRVSRL